MNSKLLLSLLCISSSIFSMIDKRGFEKEHTLTKFDRKSYKSEPQLKQIELLHKGKKIYTQHGENAPVRVTLLGDNLKKNIKEGIQHAKSRYSYLYLQEVNGQIKVDSKQKLHGEGPVGATFGAWTGRILTYGIWEGVIAVVKGTSKSDEAGEVLRVSAAPVVEGTAKTMSLGLGIFFGAIIPW